MKPGDPFRVLTDGLRFKIQRREVRRFLWWRWEVWVNCGRLLSPRCRVWATTYYDNREHALQECERLNREARQQHEWTVVIVPPSPSAGTPR